MNFAKSIIKKVVRAIELLTDSSITVKPRPRVKIQVHPNAVSNGDSMQFYVDLVEKFCDYKPRNIFEIGANYAQDAEYLRKSFNLEEKDVYVFEPHPQIFTEIKKLYNFNAFDQAVSNTTGKTTFNAIDVFNNEYNNSGISSLRNGLCTNKQNFIEVEVDLIRMDDFIREHKIETIDFLKLDVEGMNYEVLEGFGEQLSCVKAIQTEGEYAEYWEGQKLYKDMEELLIKNGFTLVFFLLSRDGVQSDSFWIQDKHLLKAI